MGAKRFHRSCGVCRATKSQQRHGNKAALPLQRGPVHMLASGAHRDHAHRRLAALRRVDPHAHLLEHHLRRHRRHLAVLDRQHARREDAAAGRPAERARKRAELHGGGVASWHPLVQHVPQRRHRHRLPQQVLEAVLLELRLREVARAGNHDGVVLSDLAAILGERGLVAPRKIEASDAWQLDVDEGDVVLSRVEHVPRALAAGRVLHLRASAHGRRYRVTMWAWQDDMGAL